MASAEGLIFNARELIDAITCSRPIRTAPGAGSILGVGYWCVAAERAQIPPNDILLDCGSQAAVAYEALTAGFLIAFNPNHPAYDRLDRLAQQLNLFVDKTTSDISDISVPINGLETW